VGVGCEMWGWLEGGQRALGAHELEWAQVMTLASSAASGRAGQPGGSLFPRSHPSIQRLEEKRFAGAFLPAPAMPKGQFAIFPTLPMQPGESGSKESLSRISRITVGATTGCKHVFAFFVNI